MSKHAILSFKQGDSNNLIESSKIERIEIKFQLN